MTSEQQIYDVIIVGAGPAGCSCAVQLANSGLEVALIDKAEFPRDKICGDALSLDVVNQLSRLSPELADAFDARADRMPSYGVTIGAPNNKAMEIPFYRYIGDGNCGYLYPRYEFDNLLYQHLKGLENVGLKPGSPVKTVSKDNGYVHVSTSKENLKARMVVGSDGAHSVVNRHLKGLKVDKDAHAAGLRVYYEGVTGFNSGNYIELHFFREILPGYLWIFPLNGGKANIGIGILSSKVSEKKINLKKTLNYLLENKPKLKERFKDAKPLENAKGFGLPLGSKKRSISGENFLLAGDAAGLIDPFTGEGIGNAIRSGRIAGDHIQRAFRENDFSASFNRAYDKEIYRKMWKEMNFSRNIQRIFRYPWLFNFVFNKASQSMQLQHHLMNALLNTSFKQLLAKPKFYWQMLKRK